MPVDERQPHGEGLGHPHQGVIDRLVAVRVVFAHDVADDPRGFDVAAIGPQAQLVHAVENSALHRLEPVAGIGQRAGVDDRHGVFEEGIAHLLADIDVDDLAVIRGRGLAAGAWAGHTCGISFGGVRRV